MSTHPIDKGLKDCRPPLVVRQVRVAWRGKIRGFEARQVFLDDVSTMDLPPSAPACAECDGKGWYYRHGRNDWCPVCKPGGVPTHVQKPTVKVCEVCGAEVKLIVVAGRNQFNQAGSDWVWSHVDQSLSDHRPKVAA